METQHEIINTFIPDARYIHADEEDTKTVGTVEVPEDKFKVEFSLYEKIKLLPQQDGFKRGLGSVLLVSSLLAKLVGINIEILGTSITTVLDLLGVGTATVGLIRAGAKSSAKHNNNEGVVSISKQIFLSIVRFILIAIVQAIDAAKGGEKKITNDEKK